MNTNNLFAFHGMDHKAGVTMIAQSIAEIIAQHNKDLKILFISLSGRKNNEYFKGDLKSIDDFKLQLDSKLIVEKDFMRDCRYKDNLYVLSGIANEQEERYYFPEHVKYLIHSIENGFDVIIADTGSSLDNGLAFGALCIADKKFLIMGQQESHISRYEEKINVFQHADIHFEKILVNHYQEDDPYNIAYISQRIDAGRETFLKIRTSPYYRQAEMEHRTLIEFKTEKYNEDIVCLSNQILDCLGIQMIKVQRRVKWKSFI